MLKTAEDIGRGGQDPGIHNAKDLDLVVILPLVLKYWYWFVISIIAALFCSFLYVRHTMPIYRTTATILVNETEARPVVDNSEILQGLGLPGGMRNLQNQIMIIKSRDLTEKTLSALDFEVEYYIKTIRNKLPIYPEEPIRVVANDESTFPRDTEFSLTFLGNNKFNIEASIDEFQLNKTASFGDTIMLPRGSFQIECWNEKWIRDNDKISFVIHSFRRLVNDYYKRVEVEQVSREGSVLRLSIEGTNRFKDVDFLNKHIEGFQAISLIKKNTEAERRIRFIDGQLVGISDSLSVTENRLQQFRSSNRVMDLSAQGQSLIGQVTLLENERARLSLEANYYDYLYDYLSKDASGEAPIIPITMGITDPGLTRIVEELAELQGQLSTRGAGEMNPLQRNLEQRVRTAKSSLRETLNGLRRANSLARSENQEQINKANSQASSLPVTERLLLGIERKFELNNELYTFLLETRAEQEMQRASNRADSEVIDPADARFSSIVSPKAAMTNLVAIFIGFIIPLTLILLRYFFNNKLTEDNIRGMTNLPVVGNIPHSSSVSNTAVFDDPNSSIAEAFRLLRSKMQFFTKDARSPVIMITSTMPGDGKTFTAINLASAYSLLGLKTVLIGFDLRKPKIFQDFSLSNEKGISTWLIGKDSVKDIIQETEFKNLSVIPAGPIPPNPSELTALARTEELFKQLKGSYDYIIVDTSPIGVVSDTYHLAALSDTCIMVVRPGQTFKTMFENTMHEIEISGIKDMSLVVNDIMSHTKKYGYGEKYGYTTDSKRSGKGLLKKKRAKHPH